MTGVAARARGLLGGVIHAEALAEAERAVDGAALTEVLGRSGLAAPDADALERVVSARGGRDYQVLARWTDKLGPLALDEDRRSVRAIARGLVAGIPAAERLAGAVPTASLPAARLAELAAASNPRELAAALARARHPFAPIVAAMRPPSDLLELELALARRFAELVHTRDRALRTYLEQAIDAENASAALMIAARGTELAASRAFLPSGARVTRAVFLDAAIGPVDRARDVLGHALAGTPLGAALLAPAASAFEDATLAWQLATQARLRRTDPLGLAPAIYTLLRRRDEARRLRRASWRVALEAT